MVNSQDTKKDLKTKEDRDKTSHNSDSSLSYHNRSSRIPSLDHHQAVSEKETPKFKQSKATTSKQDPSHTSGTSDISHKRAQPSQTQRHTPSIPRQPNKPPLPSPTMSKLSPSLKQLINAPFSKPTTTTPNPQTLRKTLNKLVSSAQSNNVSTPAWLTFTTATAMTMNSPSTMLSIYQTAVSQPASHLSPLTPITTAELQREVGLKCISFNGIPRAINCLGAFHSALPSEIQAQLSTTPTREYTSSTLEPRKSDGLSLWDSVYAGFERKLLQKLSQSHPDLPVHILHSHYANLLSNPSRQSYTSGIEKPRETHVGRVLTSLVAIACLRAQTGVGPQVTSHVFGLRKAYENGDAEGEGEVEVGGGKWLSGEEGNKWLLEWIDELVRAIGTRQEEEMDGGIESGTTFAPGIGGGQVKAKL